VEPAISKKIIVFMNYSLFRSISCILLLVAFASCRNDNTSLKDISLNKEQHGKQEGEEGYDGPGIAAQQEFNKTKDPLTGLVPRETLWPIIEYTEQLKQDVRAIGGGMYSKTALNGWTERGPYGDTRGPSNGNLRGPNSDTTSGRIRAVMVDASDATGNTVWVGGVAGGLWKTTSITSRPAGWTLVNDKLSNLAVTSICQNPAATSTMYFCTGEGVYNSDAVQGNGVFKSTNGGASWTQLSSTTGSSFNYCSRILCDASGNVYVGTRSGLFRSINGGTSWTNITPSGVNSGVSDMEISSTGRLHLATAFGSTAYYRFTDTPATVPSSGWTSATTPFSTSSTWRVVLDCQGNNLIALPSNSSTDEVDDVFKSIDGGVTWAATTNTPGFTNGQGWYCLAAAINPAAPTNYIVASLNCYRSTNSGTSWSKITDWASGSAEYVHADQQDLIWYTASSQSRVLAVSDGGIFLSTDGGSNWSDRNSGLRIKQFYSCALHPTSNSNYLLGGAQDNGCHSFSNAGLSTTVEVTGGDGAFVHIDQDEPQYQFGSYVYNIYRRSTNTGSSWGTVTLNGSTGEFINPTDYDNTNNVMYCSEATSGYRRWTDPQSGSTSSVVSVTALSGSVYAVAVSPFTANRIFLGTSSGRLVMVDNAAAVSSPTAGTLLASSLGTISSISFGGSDDTMIVTSSSYSGTQVWYSTNATAGSPTFTAKDGNLANMPVRWSLIIPNTSGKRIMLATETGVWASKDISAASPTWIADPNFPNVRTDMLRYRSSDLAVAAATHGRGMWTATAADAVGIALPYNEFVLKASPGNQTTLTWTFKTARQAISFDIERSEDGSHFSAMASQVGGASQSTYQYSEERSIDWKYYRIKSTDQYGLVQYSNIVSVAPVTQSLQLSNVFPNPAKDQVNLTVFSPGSENIRLQLYSVSGQKLKDVTQQLGKGSQNISLSVSSVSPGNYLLIATVGKQRFSYVVIRQ
jgi:trimeric autotransporter adhesin